MADFQLPTLNRGVAGIDQAIQLLHAVTGGLNRATDQAAAENDRQGDDDDAHPGTHRERRSAGNQG